MTRELPLFSPFPLFPLPHYVPNRLLELGDIKNSVRCDVGERGEICQGTKLYISKAIVKPEFRGLGLGLYMIDEACRKINDGMSLTIICPSPLDEDGRPLGCGREQSGAIKKLRGHYSKLGFADLGDNSMARWNGYRSLNLRHVCPYVWN